VPPLTPEAQARPVVRGGSSFGGGPFNSSEDFSLYDRCITRGIPGSMMPAIYGNAYEIVQAPGTVAIRYEMIHETRVIPLDGRPHAGKGVQLDMGDGRGHWEGDTLVESPRMVRDDRRSDDLDEAVDVRDAPHEGRARHAAVRICLP
jgi:hypothetical protein